MKDHLFRNYAIWLTLLCGLSFSLRIAAAVPNIITYQGRVSVGGAAFTGTGYFKFALVGGDGSDQVWRNDGLALDTEPPVSVTVPVVNGLFMVPLGDNSLPGMALLPSSLLANNNALKLRAWFSDGTTAFTQLAPDTPLTSSPYALVAASALTVPNGSIGAAQIASNSITAGQLAPGAAAANLGSSLNPVPSGGIVLSELEVNPSFLDAGYVPFGGQFTLSGDVWTNVPPGPPSTGGLSSGRYGHKAVWTGTEMLVIGGTPNSDGLRYSPSANTWTIMNKTNAPAIGEDVQIAWTGSRLLVWDSYHRVGGRYNPNTDTWQEMSRTNAPSAREQEAGVFVGGYLVIWGGHEAGVNDNFLRTGGRYNPTNDTWVALPTSGAPPARARPTGTAIGTEAIFFGGYSSGDQVRADGGRYNVGANSWTSMAAAPEPRDLHTATWSDTYMYVWGGFSFWSYHIGVNTERGMRYNPSTDNWTFLPTNGQPCNVVSHSAVWNGTSLIIWGGYCGVGEYQREPTKAGARFNQSTGTWTPVSSVGVNRSLHSAVWTGTQMIVWAGWEHDSSSELDDGWRYTPASDSWTSTSVPAGTGEPSQRQIATTIWAGDALIVWGGWSGLSALRSGGIYRPGSGWTNTPTTGAPSARYFHTAVWTGSEMIVWGGVGSLGTVPVNTGGRFNLAANRWFPLSTANAPRARAGHTAVWTGTEMIIWGGYDYTNLFSPTFLWTGARYNPASNTWTALPPPLLIPGRAGHTAVWSGNEMLIWGGYTHDGGLPANYSHYNLGFSYIPGSNTWRFLSSSGLSGRRGHTAIWDGDEMLVWGGYGDSGHTNTGARYHPASDTWTPIATNGAPAARKNHTAVWGDHAMIIWGGENTSSTLNTGAMYDPLADKWATMTNTPPTDRKYHGAVWTGSRMIVVNGVDDAGNEFGANANENRAFIPRRILYPYQKP